MSLAESKNAIGAVSSLIERQLGAETSVEVKVGHLEKAAKLDTNAPKFNLFLYQVDIDASLRNIPLDAGQKTPIWLVLRYLLTAFDDKEESDSVAAHMLLGKGMLALQELNYIELKNTDKELLDNPEPLKITFDSADVELLSKIMQGSDEKYRISAAFQVRPVMIAPTVAPSYALPVKTIGPPGHEGVAVMPSLGPVLDAIEPMRFEAGEQIVLRGNDLAGIDKIRVGGKSINVSFSTANQLKIIVPANIALSAGSHMIQAIRMMPSGRESGSNAVLGFLLPKLVSVSHSLTVAGSGKYHGDVTLTGEKLGGVGDSIFVAFYGDGKTELMLEAAGSSLQTELTVTVDVDAGQALLSGIYFIILRVNGEQAREFPQVILP